MLNFNPKVCLDWRINMKTDIRKTGVTLLLFYLVFMLLASSFTLIGNGIAVALLKIHNTGAKFMQESSQAIGMIVGVIIALLVIFKWLRTDLSRTILFQKGSKRMDWKILGMSILFLFGAQFLFSSLSVGLDQILRVLGLSIESEIKSAQGINQAPLQLIYTLILGPVAEELIFRGAIFQVLRKYGRVFAIMSSAVLFGIYHGNLPQGIFAFTMGILFAYITAEYSIYWSMLIHIFNNVNTIWMNYGISKLNWGFLGVLSNIIYVFALIVIIGYLYKNRKKIKYYLKRYPTQEGVWRCLFESKSVIIFTILNIITAIAGMI